MICKYILIKRLHINKHTCTVSLDSSGKSLHKRGYKTDTIIAPINEVLAAGMILLSGWNKKDNFHDPMCGSGTLLIEAALIAYNIPANIFRDQFGFEKSAIFATADSEAPLQAMSWEWSCRGLLVSTYRS